MLWLLSYVGANWALILVVVLAVAGLGAVAFFAKNWKVAVAALAVLAAGFAYQQIDKNAYQRRVAEEAADKVRALEERLNVLNAANEQDAMRATADAARISELEDKTNAMPPPASPGRAGGLDRAAARRVSAIRWADPGQGGPATGAIRHPDLLSRRRRPAGP